MFEAPRPISHAPTHAHFTPSPAPNHVTPFGHALPTSSHSASNSSNSTSALMHTVAVPLPVSNTHRPIAISAHRGSASGGNSAAAARALHFVSRVQTADPMRHDSPLSSASPSIFSHSASASPAVHMSQPGTNVAGLGVGFSLSTPSPPPHAPSTTDTPIPSSPMMSPSFFGGGLDSRDRRDSVDDNEQASAHLQGILWRNAAALRAAVSGRHPQTPQFGPQSGGAVSQQALPQSAHAASPARTAMSPLAPNHSLALTPTSQGSFSRAIPIAKRSGATIPIQLSILGQMQHGEDGVGPSQAHVYANASREGSRRGSGSNPGQFHGGTSPLAGTSLGSSFILSHTPPVRAGNPLDRDSRFSPAQQAEYLIKQQSEYDMLPMMMAHHGLDGKHGWSHHQPYQYQGNSFHGGSPIVQRSTLSLSLAARQTNPNGIHKFASPQLTYQSTGIMNQPPPMPLETVDDDDETIYPKLSCTL